MVEALKLVLVTGHEHRLECWRTNTRAVPVRWQAVSCVVGSAHGWLGAVGFAASAYRLECRDRWPRRRGKVRPFAPGGQLVSRPGCRASPRTGRVVRAARLRRTLRLPLLETFEDRHAGTSCGQLGWRDRGPRAAGPCGNGNAESCRAGESAFRNRLRRWKSALVWTGRAGRSSAARRWGMRVRARAW